MHAVDMLWRTAPPRDRKAKSRNGLRAGSPQLTHPKYGHRPIARQGRDARFPHVIGVHDMAIHAKMVAQGMAGHPFDHPLGQTEIRHPRERDFQGLITCNRLDACP